MSYESLYIVVLSVAIIIFFIGIFVLLHNFNTIIKKRFSKLFILISSIIIAFSLTFSIIKYTDIESSIKQLSSVLFPPPPPEKIIILENEIIEGDYRGYFMDKYKINSYLRISNMADKDSMNLEIIIANQLNQEGVLKRIKNNFWSSKLLGNVEFYKKDSLPVSFLIIKPNYENNKDFKFRKIYK